MKRFVLIAALIIMGLVSIDVLFTPLINKNNSTVIEGHFQDIIRKEYRGDYSYDLTIQENGNSYFISTDNSSCFLYNIFINTVKEGQVIKIRMAKNDLIRKPSICGLSIDGVDYLSVDCANNRISNNRFWIPIGSRCL